VRARVFQRHRRAVGAAIEDDALRKKRYGKELSGEFLGEGGGVPSLADEHAAFPLLSSFAA
jgi:hypothetical protein